MPTTSWNPLPRRRALALVFALVALPFAGLAGCGDSPDQKAIRANWKRYYFAIQEARALDYYDLIGSGTVEFYDKLVPLAARGAKAEIAALSPAEKREIVVMRNRIPFAKLNAMDGRAYILHAIAERYWVDKDDDDDEQVNDPSAGDGPWKYAKIVVSGNSAVAEFPARVTVDPEPTFGRRRYRNVHVEKGYMYFVKQDGAWRVDEVALIPALNKDITEYSKGMGVEKFLIEIESLETDKEVREDIFDKPPK